MFIEWLGSERNQRKKGVIKLADKINLSRSGTMGYLTCLRWSCRSLRADGTARRDGRSRKASVLWACWLLGLTMLTFPSQNVGASQSETPQSAQVPPRSEAAQEQREEKSPLDYDQLSLTRWCTLTFVGKGGKEAVLDFCGEKLTYSGELGVDEPARLFFEALLENIAACESRKKEKREE